MNDTQTPRPESDDAQALKQARDAAYRRLAVAILALDVPTLADALSASRQHDQQAA